MVLQKKKHPHYRKRITNTEKQQLREAIRLKERQSLKQKLYNLPLDLKVKIFSMAINNNLNIWKNLHMKPYLKTISIFDDIHISSQEDVKGRNHLTWISDAAGFAQEEVSFRHVHVCEHRASKPSQNHIVDVYIPYLPTLFPIIHRMWSNKVDYYWYHTTCRCKQCDMVRIKGYDYLPMKEKEKYKGIQWNADQDQWKAKSFQQMKYEKNRKREINRKLMRQIKEQALMEEEFLKYVEYNESTKGIGVHGIGMRATNYSIGSLSQM